MMKFYVETISNISDRRKGPIDPATGWTTVHSTLICEASTEAEAQELFEKKFPRDVLAVLPLDE